MIGVSFTRKWHFYKDKFNQDEKYSSKKKLFMDTGSPKEKEMLNIIDFIVDEGYVLRYTDTSKVLSKTKATKIQYSHLKYSKE